tara:strand:+ start:2648 stop:3328 length:681 start_codon:yes stop_codon:yes gene_type:complete
MKLVRALWGTRKDILNEIPRQPQLDEVVYVWGKNNWEYLISLGYETRYVTDTEEMDYKFKLDAIDLAYEEFGNILFLDWDCIPTQNIKGLEFNSPSMPLYSYPKDYILGDSLNWNPILQKQIPMYSWEFKDSYVLPNASCIPVQGFNLGKELKKIHRKYKFNTLVEEFSFKMFTNCSLDEYIQNYDSPYLYGRDSSQYFWVNGEKVNTAKVLNNYIGDKNIKFIHE